MRRLILTEAGYGVVNVSVRPGGEFQETDSVATALIAGGWAVDPPPPRPPRQSTYVPTGRPRGRPRLSPLPESAAEPEAPTAPDPEPPPPEPPMPVEEVEVVAEPHEEDGHEAEIPSNRYERRDLRAED
jgi:hypothetical protein